MRLYIGPYQPSDDPLFPGRTWPVGAVGAIDLAPLALQANQSGSLGMGLFTSPRALPSEYTLLGNGEPREIKATAKMRAAIATLTGLAVNGDSLADLALDCLIGGADPQGDAGPLPIVPTDQGWMELHLPGIGYAKGERYEWATTGHRNKLRTLLRRQFRQAFGDEQAGKLRPNMARKILDAYCDKYGLQGTDDWKEFVPADLQKEIPGRLKHETTISETFNTADSSTLGPLLSWTELGGDFWSVTSNAARRVDNTDINRLARADSDLSSSDHYSQADATVISSSPDQSQAGVACRIPGDGSNTCYFTYAYDAPSNGMGAFRIVSGTYTLIGTGTAITLSLPDTLRISANGSTIKTYFNGVEIHSVTDTNIPGNVRCGLYGLRQNSGGDVRIDNFEASDLAAASILYTQLERSTRGLMRGTWTGGM